MEKTQKILKRFISLILTFAISFGSYVFPVFAALPEDNEAPTIEEVVQAYADLQTQEQKVTDKMTEIRNSSEGVSVAKTTALDEADTYLTEYNNAFINNTLRVKTTAYDVITVVVDFNDLSDTTSLGITLTNETMKAQVLKDTYSVLQEYYYELEFVYLYLEQSEDYTILINEAGNKFETVSTYVQKLEELDITYDSDLYETYALELAKLMVADDELQENIDSITKLSSDLDTYTNSITTILKTNLLQKYEELNKLANDSTLTGMMDTVRSVTSSAIAELNSDNYDLIQLSNNYINMENTYNSAIEVNNKTNPTEKYVDSEIEKINTQLSETINLDITVEQIMMIEELLDSPINVPMSVESLVAAIDADKLSEKLISGELNYEVLAAFVDVINNHIEVIDAIYELTADIDNSANADTLNPYLEKSINNDIFGSNGGYMEELTSIENTSKTDEERLSILDKLNLIEFSLEILTGVLEPNEDSVTPIIAEIERLKEFYSKSADNKLTNLIVNGIEMDVTEETYKVYVGNDVTEIKVLFEQSNPNAKVEILNAKDLKVGTNEVIVIVTAENGEVRQYTIEVVRAEKESSVVTTNNTDSATDEVETITLNNSTSEETIDDELEGKEEHKNTSDSNEKYDEEIEEEEGLSALTVLLIVIGIALVAYGVYKVFGDKEDQKIEKAFEQPKVNSNKPKPKSNKNHKKRK